MKYLLFFLLLSVTIPAVSQDALHNISGTWKAVSKIETKTKGGSVTEKDEEIYQTGEKTYAFTGTEVTITQGYGKHKETLPLDITGNQVFIGKKEKNKEPYVISTNSNQLILTKTKQKMKKGKAIVETEVVTLEK